MRTTFVESLSPQGPVIALDTLLEELRRAVPMLLWGAPSHDDAAIVAQLEASFDELERAATALGAPLLHAARRALGEMRALLWAMLPMELYPALSTPRRPRRRP